MGAEQRTMSPVPFLVAGSLAFGAYLAYLAATGGDAFFSKKAIIDDDGVPWEGGNRTFFDPANPKFDICPNPKCMGLGTYWEDGYQRICRTCSPVIAAVGVSAAAGLVGKLVRKNGNGEKR